MNNKELPENFWYENVSRSDGKHNLSPDAWERICKVRNTPIQLIEDFVIGESHKPHKVIPKGYKGYLIDYPEAFYLSDHDQKAIYDNSLMSEDLKGIPTWFFGIDHVVFIFDYHYEIIPPYFDMSIANYANPHVINN